MAIPVAVAEKIQGIKHLYDTTLPKVIMAEIVDSLPVQVVGPRKTIRVGQVDAGREITALHLHPAGLLVVRDGRKLLIPLSKVSFVELE